MAEGGGKAKPIKMSEEEKLALVVRLLYHQGPINWDGFEIRTGHSQRALGGVLDRLKAKYVAGSGENSNGNSIQDDSGAPNKRKSKKAGRIKDESTDGEDAKKLKGAAGKKAVKFEIKSEPEESDSAEVGARNNKRKRTASKTPALDVPTKAKSKRSKSKAPVPESAAKKAKTGVTVEV